MKLVIVESPTKARTIGKFLGHDYVIKASMGHVVDLHKSKSRIDFEHDFAPLYEVVADKRQIIAELKTAAKNADQIILATDPDREWEAIASHISDVLGSSSKFKVQSSKFQRIAFHEITKEAIEEALKNPREIDNNLVDAQTARRVLDRLVGYKLSPLLWKKVRRGLSAGRVQSVTVRLIVEREREIEAFKSVEYWEIYSIVKSLKLKVKSDFSVKLLKINGKTADVKNEKEAKTVVADLEKSGYKVFDVRKKEVRKNPYPPFTTSTMTQSGARLFGWSAKKTMNIAQRLYEEGLITYHRTDSVNLSTVAIEKAREYIDKNYGKNYVPQKPRFFKKTSKLVQEAHEAIRPTDVNSKFQISSSKFEKEGEILYNIIWKRFVACQVEASIFDETIIDVLATPKLPATSYLLRASGQVMKFDGWRKVIPLSKDEEPELPLVEKDEALDLIKVISEQKFTQPPPRYNEASLIKTLEKLGIGRPSTYAPTITTIQIRYYVEKIEGKFQPTPIGVAVNDFLVTNFKDIVDYSFTAEMEKELDDIAKGELEWEKMMKVFYAPFDKKLVDVEKNSKRVKIEAEKLGKKCPTCEKEGRVGDKQGELVIRTGRFGKFISCSLFPECKHTEKYIEKLGMKCPKCGKGDVIVRNTKTGRKFFGCSRYPDCKWASWKKPVAEKEKKEI